MLNKFTPPPQICFALAALLFVLPISSCGNSSPDNKSTDSIDESSNIEQTETTELSDTVPNLNFNGAEFRTIVQTNTEIDIYSGESTGDVFSDSVYDRNRKIEERFNVKIVEPEIRGYQEVSSIVNQAVMADDAAYDLVLGQMMTSGGDAQNGIFMNWNDVPYVDFSKPWWTKSLRDATEINGKCYIAMSDMCISYTRQTWAIVFDKIETENRGINDVYESVENGTWTIDKLNSYTKDVYIDLNNDGISNEGDYFGYSTEIAGCPAVAYLYGFNQHIAVINGNKIDIVLNCEKAANIFEKLTALLENPGTFELSQHKLSSHFLTGNVMFTHLQIGTCYDKLRDYERDYGIIPFPKWDEAQEEYYSVVDAGCNVLCIPINIRDKELTGAIVEALSAESYKSVMPTFCDIALGVKTTRDEKSQEMLKLVLNNRYIDFAYIYDAWKGWVFKLQDLFGGKFASTYKQYEESTQNYYNSVLEFLNSDE